MDLCIAGGQPIYSTFGVDPDLGDLVEMFVEEMSHRVNTLIDLLESSDWEGTATLAHQLKGAGGSYGFAAITDRALVLETAAREGSSADAIRTAADALVDVCRRIRSGAPE